LIESRVPVGDEKEAVGGVEAVVVAGAGGPGPDVAGAQTFEHNPDLFFRRIWPAYGLTDVSNNLLGRFLHRPAFLAHLRSLGGCDDSEILPYSTAQICPIGADREQVSVVKGFGPHDSLI
jgi:hypothetical protein